MGSLPLMLNHLQDDCHMCHIKKMKKKTLMPFENANKRNDYFLLVNFNDWLKW